MNFSECDVCGYQLAVICRSGNLTGNPNLESIGPRVKMLNKKIKSPAICLFSAIPRAEIGFKKCFISPYVINPNLDP